MGQVTKETADALLLMQLSVHSKTVNHVTRYRANSIMSGKV